MVLSQAYLEWEQVTIKQGLERGLEQKIQLERRIILKQIFRSRFGQLDDALNLLVQELTKLPLLLSLSRDELVNRFTPKLGA